MAKQSMGIPFYNMKERCDNKTYLLNYVQKPIVINDGYERCLYSEFPTGINGFIILSF